MVWLALTDYTYSSYCKEKEFYELGRCVLDPKAVALGSAVITGFVFGVYFWIRVLRRVLNI